MREKRVAWLLLAALILFLAVLGVSRLADFGVLPGEPFGAGDVERNKVRLDLAVRTPDGEVQPIGRVLVLSRQDRLELTYGPTRYPYLWVVAIDPKGRAEPLVKGALTRAQGETLHLDPPEESFVLLCLFSAVPRTIEQIQDSLDRDVRLPGLRFAWVIDVEASDRSG